MTPRLLLLFVTVTTATGGADTLPVLTLTRSDESAAFLAQERHGVDALCEQRSASWRMKNDLCYAKCEWCTE